MFKKIYLFFCFIFICNIQNNLFSEIQSNNSIPCILVSVAPYKFFVEKIAQDTVKVILMVPPGASAHTYEPTARQILGACEGKVWFRIGESFENRAINALKSHQPHLEIVDLRQGLDLIHSSECKGCCCAGGEDLHFWLSPKMVKIQAHTITDAIIQLKPQFKDFYLKNLSVFEAELDQLNQEIQTTLSPLQNRNILVSHPAYAYFCRDYQLNQFSIEMEGKDPTPQQMTRLMNTIRDLKIKTIYIQMQYNNKAAKLVADTLNMKLITLNPYAENYFQSLREIANAFAQG
ncbi:MAG: zinc ABC transporter substrate-binding protein [Parachlamydiaceae bacterium]|nr:zinc ABC transporter substrate-binding protein [Parachlamydiaceae bacterium]